MVCHPVRSGGEAKYNPGFEATRDIEELVPRRGLTTAATVDAEREDIIS
jgi:hypothetical protein